MSSGRVSSSKSPAKTKRTGVSRKIQGRLQNMLLLPFDVLYVVCLYPPESQVCLFLNEPLSQIFSEVGPMDLVNLSRTNKALRDVLMSRKSIWVWLMARRNAGITKVPDPPDDMSEPAWALLLFGPAVCSVRSRESLRIVSISG